MLATVAREVPTDEAAWAAEFKWDGARAIADVASGGLRLRSRSGRDVTATFPELAELTAAVWPREMILDGEIVAFGESGRPDFAALQRRMHLARPAARRVAAVPVTFMVFDVLYLDGQTLLRRPYDHRRAVLEGLGLARDSVQVPPAFPGAGHVVLGVSAEHGLEGVVLKRLDSPYQPGRRSKLWLKIKHLSTVDVVIGGWRPGHGRRAGLVGSLLLGVDGPAGLEYCGSVGTGFTEAMLRQLTRLLAALEQATSPFAAPVPPEHARDARWVRPVLVGEVAFAEWSPGGRLRHPVWRGLKADSPASEQLPDLRLQAWQTRPRCSPRKAIWMSEIEAVDNDPALNGSGAMPTSREGATLARGGGAAEGPGAVS